MSAEDLSARVASMEGLLAQLLSRLPPSSATSTSSGSSPTPILTEQALGQNSGDGRQGLSPAAAALRDQPGHLGVAAQLLEPSLQSLPHPRVGKRSIKPVSRFLADSGFYPPTIALSQRSKGEQGQDPAKAWRLLFNVCAEAVFLLGPPPAQEDVQAFEWYTRFFRHLTFHQAQALVELAEVEARRIAPNVSRDIVRVTLHRTWPDFSAFQAELARLQRDCASVSALLRLSTSESGRTGGAAAKKE